jgi:hypothetical protein
MRYSAPGQAGRPPEVAPRDAPHHGELIAVIALVLLLAHLLLAQLTLLLAAVMYVIDRVSRWRPEWLAAPAGAGLLWVLAIGPSRAMSGFTAGPRHVLGYLGGIGGHPGHLLHLSDAYAGLAHWLPEQFPLALILAAAEVLGLSWLQRRLGGGRPWRAGLIVTARRRTTAAALRSGAGVVTRDGCCVGVDVTTGRPAAISWREAEGAVLCAGTAVGQSGFALAHAAIRRRKPVIVIDLTGSPRLAESLAAVCTEAGAPFSCFGLAGPCCYEPLRGGDPARAAALVMATIDWTDVGDQQRRSCAAYLTDALAVQAAAPGDRRLPVLDDLVGLLTPDGLRERAAHIPPYHPRRDVLADRVAVSAGLLQADPSMVATPAAQLPRLRASALGRWLGPGLEGTGTPRVSLGQTVRDRGVTLFSLDRGADDNAAAMIAGLVVADLTAVCGELAGMSVPGDSLAWINGCEVVGQRALADLVRIGHGAGMAVVLGTGPGDTADRLAAEVNVLVADGPVDQALIGAFTGGVRAGGGWAGGNWAGASGAGGNRAGASGASGNWAGASGAGSNWAGASGVSGNRADGNGVGGNGAGGTGLGGNGRNGAPVVAHGIGGGPDLVTDPWLGSAPAAVGGFALLAREPRPRMLPQCRHVPARDAGVGPDGGVRPGDRERPG